MATKASHDPKAVILVVFVTDALRLATISGFAKHTRIYRQ
jgi:hypothetical protein